MSPNQVIDLTDDEPSSDFQYAMLLQEQEIANAESILIDPSDHSFYMQQTSSRGSRSNRNRSLRYQPFPIVHSHDQFDDSYEALLDLGERIGDAKPKGVSKAEMGRLPLRTVVVEEGSCSICLSEYEVGDVAKGLPCTHWYHASCIDKWLEESRFCPV